jgi:hypothetical protein
MTVTEGVRTGTGGARDVGTGTGIGTADTMAMGTAARELRLKRGEFAIAVHLGLIRLTVRQDGGRPRVDRAEIQRLRSQDGVPEALREKVRAVGTAEGAQLLGISPDRFTRLARAGCLTPIALYVNRYRAVVWLYLAEELAGFAAGEPELLVGRSPAWVRARLAEGADHRARNWRSRRIERLLSLTEDPWARAAVVAETLDPVQLAEVVDDPYERAYLARIRPEPAFAPTTSPSARETVAQLMRADEPDEMLWRRIGLIMELDNAREVRPAPRPDGGWCPRPRPLPGPRQEHDPETEAGADSEAGLDLGAETESGPESDPESGPESGSEFGVEAVPAAVAPDWAPMPDPARTPGPDPAPGRATALASGAAPAGVVEPVPGLLARFRLRRRASGTVSGTASRRRPGPGRAPRGA